MSIQCGWLESNVGRLQGQSEILTSEPFPYPSSSYFSIILFFEIVILYHIPLLLPPSKPAIYLSLLLPWPLLSEVFLTLQCLYILHVFQCWVICLQLKMLMTFLMC